MEEFNQETKETFEDLKGGNDLEDVVEDLSSNERIALRDALEEVKRKNQ